MTTIFLLRHAQSHPSRTLSSSAWPLSETGQHQARAIVPTLENLGIDQIYSSPFLRCLHTTAPFAVKAGLEVQVHDDLRECHVTHTFIRSPKKFSEVWQRSWDDFDFAMEDGETCRSGQARMLASLTLLAGSHPGSTLLISSHGNVIGLALNAIADSFTEGEVHHIRNPDLHRLEWNDGVWAWDRGFVGLDHFQSFATQSSKTPVDIDEP